MGLRMRILPVMVLLLVVYGEPSSAAVAPAGRLGEGVETRHWSCPGSWQMSPAEQ